MAEMKSPHKRKNSAFQFCANDYASDNKLALVSFAAQGLWIRMLCAMWVSDRQGYMVNDSSGKPATIAAIAVMCRCNEADAQKWIKELEDKEVFSRTPEGVIYSRRMVRDLLATEKAVQSGRKGGNPRLKSRAK
jgi:hypothetical protein